MPRIPEAKIRIGVQDKTGASLRRIRGSLDQLKKSVGGLAKGFASLGGLVGVGSLVAVGRSATALAGRLDTMSRTARVGTDTLQAFEVAALEMGFAANSAGTALQRISRRIGEVAVGTGVLKKEFDRYNISLKDNNGQLKTTEQLLRDYADVIKNASTAQEQLRLTVQAFDIEGGRFVNIMREGSAGIDQLIDRLKEAGLIMEKDTIDQLAKIGSAIERFKRKIVLSFGNILVDFDSGRGLQILELKFLKLSINFAGWIARDLARVVRFLNDLFIGVADMFVDRIKENLNAIIPILNKIPGIQVKLLGTSGADLSSVMTDALDNFEKELPKIEGFFSRAVLTIDGMIDELRELDEAGESVLIDTIPDGLKKTTDGLDKLKTSSTSTFNSFIKDLVRGGDAFGRLKNRIVDDLIDMVFAQNNLFGGILGGLFGGFSKPKGILSAASLIPGLGGIPGFQHGGSFTVGGSGGADSQLVAFRASPGERVSVSSGSGGAGIVINQTLNIGEGVNAAAQEAVFRWLPQIQAASMAGIMDAKSRGGTIANRL